MTDLSLGVTEQLDAMMLEYYGPSAAELADDTLIWSDFPFSAHAQPSALLKGQRDSLDKIEFMAAIEDEFQVRISDDAVEVLTTKALIRSYLVAIVADKNARQDAQ